VGYLALEIAVDVVAPNAHASGILEGRDVATDWVAADDDLAGLIVIEDVAVHIGISDLRLLALRPEVSTLAGSRSPRLPSPCITSHALPF
jgi:hypothetical protein